MKKYLNLELIMTGVLLAIVAVLAVQGHFVEHLSKKAMTFPNFVFIICAVIGTLEIVRNVSATRKKLKAPQVEVEIPAEAAEPEAPEAEEGKAVYVETCTPAEKKKNLFEILLLTLLYCIALYFVGFVISSIALVIVYGLRKKYKRPWVIVVAGVAVILLWYFLFTQVLGVNVFDGVLIKALF